MSLPDLTRAALRRALRRDRWETAADAELRELLRGACDAARECGLYAEQLIILLKGAWQELPEARRAPRHEVNDVLAGVITLCIEEYYRAAPRRPN